MVDISTKKVVTPYFPQDNKTRSKAKEIRYGHAEEDGLLTSKGDRLRAMR